MTSDSSAASQRYTFSGKENQATTPAQAPYLDFGARMYSADSARWLSHDPLAEKYYAVNPYSYCAGNPVMFVDPDGERPIYSTEGWLLVTDCNGLQGQPVIMDENNFKHEGKNAKFLHFFRRNIQR